MDKQKAEQYWQDIPDCKENAVSYAELMARWGANERAVRRILQELSSYDGGDNFVLVRSGTGKGFYKTDDTAVLRLYRQECLRKGKAVFAPLKKIDKLLAINNQISFENNLRVIREEKKLTQSEVCSKLRTYDRAIDKSMLSKFENGVCLPTPAQLIALSSIYGVDTAVLLDIDVFI